MSAIQIDVLDLPGKFSHETLHQPADGRFRNYTSDNEHFQRVQQTYTDMHTIQCVDYVKQKMAQWCSFSKTEMTIMDGLKLLDTLVDQSDPDVDIPNSIHAFQTAERIRLEHPDNDWFQLTGLIHDVGKVLAVWGEPQYSVVGDTFPVGCAFSDKIVFGTKSFSDNPDLNHPIFSQKYGMYTEHCGLSKVLMSWGHDEYLYRVLLNHKDCRLPLEALYAIRFHSFYPYHTSGEYEYLCDESDHKLLKWVREFNKFDLYSKADKVPDVDELIPYYERLINKYIPGKLKW